MLYTIETKTGADYGVWAGPTPRAAFLALLQVYACGDPSGHDIESATSPWVIKPFVFRFVNPACVPDGEELRGYALEQALCAAFDGSVSAFDDDYLWNQPLPPIGTELDAARALRALSDPLNTARTPSTQRTAER